MKIETFENHCVVTYTRAEKAFIENLPKDVQRLVFRGQVDIRDLGYSVTSPTVDFDAKD